MRYDNNGKAGYNYAVGMALVQVVPKNDPDFVSDVWLDPDGVHLHRTWNITNAGAPDKRARPDCLVHWQSHTKGQPKGFIVGHYIMATPENLKRLREHHAKIYALEQALDQALKDRDAELALSALDGGAS